MNREKLYVNPERFEEELKRHRGQYHPIEKINGRRARLWVQADIAAIINLSKERLSTVKQGKDAISERALLDLARAWGVNWKWLCNLSDSRTEEEERKEEIKSWINEEYEKFTREMDYMERLGFVTDPTPKVSTVTVYYRHEDKTEPEKIVLTHEQFKAVRDAMNRAAVTAVLSCFELLNVPYINEPDMQSRILALSKRLTEPEDSHPEEEAPSE